MLHVYAQADDAQALIELGIARKKPEVTSPYPHLVSMEMMEERHWEMFTIPCDDVPCDHIAYRIPDPEHAQCGWLVSHGVVQWQPAEVWTVLARWADVQSEVAAVS